MFSITEKIYITERKSTLTVSDLNKNDIGMYQCKANNTLVKTVNNSSPMASLNVLCKHT